MMDNDGDGDGDSDGDDNDTNSNAGQWASYVINQETNFGSRDPNTCITSVRR